MSLAISIPHSSNVVSVFSFVILSVLLPACSSVPENNIQQQAVLLENSTQTQSKDPSTPLTDQTVLTSYKKDKPRATLRIKAVGDVMLGTNFPEDWLPPKGQDLLADVATTLSDADITFGNYEGTLLDGGEPAKECKNPKRCYVFRTPPSFVNQLVNAGFDVMSLANNHARDFGDEGRMSSMSVMKQAGIQHSGIEGDIASWEVNGKKILMVAFAPFRGANNPLEIEPAAQWVSGLADQHDIVIISMHMGAEGEDAIHVTFAEEMFHGENRGDIVAFSRAMVDAGADLVIGHGPHVPRALELYEGRLIAYSLGNFCTYFGINVRGRNGLAPILDVTLYGDGEFKLGNIISARQVRPNGPALDPQYQAARLMAQLTREDFPETGLEISPNGQISIKAFEPPLLPWVELP